MIINTYQHTIHTVNKNKYTECAPQINITATHKVFHIKVQKKLINQRGYNQRLQVTGAC